MKIALVHELLTIRGGAERVLKVLANMFPDAPIYTLLYNEKKLGRWFPKDRIHTSILQPSGHWPLTTDHSFNHHLYLSRFPKAVEHWDFSGFDLVISTSSAFVHGIITNGTPKHLCYVHSPARYLWDRTHDVQRSAGKGLFGPLKKFYLSRLFHRLRIWDSEAADRPDMLIAPSQEVKRRIELYWRRKSEIINPPVDDFWFEKRPSVKSGMEHPDYYLIVSSLVKYKRIELAIEAFNQSGKFLKIVGDGPDKKRLMKLAKPNIEFYGFRDLDNLADLYSSAIATVFPGNEDFGLVPLESMACGTPVIAYGQGGALETIIDGKTGMFFNDATPQSLSEAVEKSSKMKFDPDACRARAREFSRAKFEAGIRVAIGKMMGTNG